MLPCPGYCKQCCDEHWGARVSFSSGFLGVYIWPFFKRGNGEPKKETTKDMEILTGLAYVQPLLPTRNLCLSRTRLPLSGSGQEPLQFPPSRVHHDLYAIHTRKEVGTEVRGVTELMFSVGHPF